MTVASSTIVQLCLAWRIRILNKSNVLFGGILFFTFSSFVGGVASTVCAALIPEFVRFKQFRWAILTWLSSTAVADVAISAYLVHFLVMNKGNFKKTDTVINKLIMLTIQTGAITSAAAVADLLTFMLIPDTTIQFIWDFSLCKLYSNCLLSTLNARTYWRKLLEKPLSSRVSAISFCHVADIENMKE
ncbi:hypothetical protein VKT23_008739 [Stygiomarasmius scandens]|uniref:DUF6534 domain-containing protein n=1 Tax=Marasmiellus scandens TaxID=2682957 RepID=A0ABR1JK23_9AGAR